MQEAVVDKVAAKDVIEQGPVVMEPVVGNVASVAVEDIAVPCSERCCRSRRSRGRTGNRGACKG